MTNPIQKAKERIKQRLINHLEKHPDGLTIKQISKDTQMLTETVCELLSEIGAEVHGDLWTLPVKKQSSDKSVYTTNTKSSPLVKNKKPIKETFMQNPQKIQRQSVFATVNQALEEQIKRLTQQNLDAETMNLEAVRTRALTSISEQFIKQGQVVIEATKLDIEFGGNRVDSGLLTIGG